MPSHPNLLAFGSNGSGQLGIGHDEDVSFPTRCIFEDSDSGEITETRDASVTRIVAGGNHTLVLLGDGRVYAAGCDEDGRCGGRRLGSRTETTGMNSVQGSKASVWLLSRFRRMVIADEGSGKVHDTFKEISATWEATFLVPLVPSYGEKDDRDAVYVLGSGTKGELGLGVDVLRTGTATRIPDFPPMGTRITKIASGMGHTVVVLSNGEVYGWGGARKGQLGEFGVAKKIAWAPVKIDGVPFRVTGAACGREFTALGGDRDAGEFVVLGAAGDKWEIRSGIPSPGSESVKGYLNIDASWHGVYVHQRDGSVLAWGRNDRGQLPPGDLRSVRKVAVGSEHVLALLHDRTVVACGWGEHGNCGPGTDAQGNVKGICSPVPLPERGFEAVGVGAGCATSWIIAS
ncbi:regulator of chromosome condensation 1/beta-lactamase-inhibitor protein II [Aspergillus heterothallicus]